VIAGWEYGHPRENIVALREHLVELFAVLDHDRGIERDSISIDECQLIDTLPLARQSIQTLYILYDPCTIPPTKDRMGA